LAITEPGDETVIVPFCEVLRPDVLTHINFIPEPPEIGEIHENEIEEPGDA
jgi:hypothetical protein